MDNIQPMAKVPASEENLAAEDRAVRRSVPYPSTEGGSPAELPSAGAVVVEPFVFLAGAHGAPPGDGDLGDRPASEALAALNEPEALTQTETLYRRMSHSLEAADSSLDRLVQLTQWTRTFSSPGPRPAEPIDPQAFWDQWRPVVDAYLKGRDLHLVGDRPASAFLPVDRLLSTDRLIELQAIAVTAKSGLRPEAVKVDLPARGGFSRAMAAGPWIVTAGFGATDPEAQLLDDVRAPRQIWYGNQIVNEVVVTLERLRRLTDDAGLDWAHVVKATLYLTPWGVRQLPAINAQWPEMWDGPGPARSVIPVRGIGVRDANVEIELIVARGGTGWEPEIVPVPTIGGLGPVPTAVRSGPLLLFSTLGVASSPRTNDRLPFLGRAATEQLDRIGGAAEAVCASQGTDLTHAVKANLFLDDFADLGALASAWRSGPGAGRPATGVFEVPSFRRQLAGCLLFLDLIVACP
jgi:enamine deaminase RidA (YjgF/YER057c/UK114 family)